MYLNYINNLHSCWNSIVPPNYYVGGETLMNNWHLIKLGSKIVAMLFGGVNKKWPVRN